MFVRLPRIDQVINTESIDRLKIEENIKSEKCRLIIHYHCGSSEHFINIPYETMAGAQDYLNALTKYCNSVPLEYSEDIKDIPLHWELP